VVLQGVRGAFYLLEMSTKSREVIYSSRIRGAKMRADHARNQAIEAAREADQAEAEAWSIRMEGYGGPAQPSPTIAQCLNGGYGWLEVKCHRCMKGTFSNAAGFSNRGSNGEKAMTKCKVLGLACLSIALAAASPVMAGGHGGGGGRGGGGGFGGHAGGMAMGGGHAGGMAMGGRASSFGVGRSVGAGPMNANASVDGARVGNGGVYSSRSFGGGQSYSGRSFAGRGFDHNGGRGHWNGGRWIGPAVGFAIGSGLGYGYGGYYDDYAYDNSYPYDGYADDASVCQPGTWFRGEDGRLYPCQ
jgi:hypothetical protein